VATVTVREEAVGFAGAGKARILLGVMHPDKVRDWLVAEGGSASDVAIGVSRCNPAGGEGNASDISLGHFCA
jgi:hypothetical protein